MSAVRLCVPQSAMVECDIPGCTVDPCLGDSDDPVAELTPAELRNAAGITEGETIAVSGCPDASALEVLRRSLNGNGATPPRMIFHASLIPKSLASVFPAEVAGFLQRCAPQDILLFGPETLTSASPGTLLSRWLGAGGHATFADGTPPADLTPEIGPGRPRVAAAAIRGGLRQVDAVAELSGGERECFESGVLLLWDLLEESHVISQSASGTKQPTTPDYWHGIMHRREPDLGNAGYWFRRVGAHPAMSRLSENLPTWMQELGWDTAAGDADGWDPFQMIEECRQALREPNSAETLHLRVRQNLEILNLLAEPWI